MDPRALAAKFYDLAPDMPNDVPFYVDRLPSPASRVLELGCGTGRVTVPLAQHCAVLHGIDHSEAMLEICRDKLSAAGIRNAEVTLGDISNFHIGSTYDFVIAPYRVLQNLETDSQVQGLFAGIRQHLRPGGRCILNTFRIGRSLEELVARWSAGQQDIDWEVTNDNERAVCYARRAGIQLHPLVLRPEHTYRRFRGDLFESIGAGRTARDAFYRIMEQALTNAPIAVRAEATVVMELLQRDLSQRGLGNAPQVPTSIIIAGRLAQLPQGGLPFDTRAYVLAMHASRRARLSTWVRAGGSFSEAVNSGHFVHADEPELVIEEIRRLVQARR